MRLSAVLLAVGPILWTAGCVSFQAMDDGMASLKGKNVEAAFNILGYPDSETKIAGKKVFTWGNHQSGSYTTPTYSTSTAYIGNSVVTFNSIGSSTEIYDYHCKFKVIASDANIIEHTGYEGNIGGCEHYAARFNAVKK